MCCSPIGENGLAYIEEVVQKGRTSALVRAHPVAGEMTASDSPRIFQLACR